jgi:V/A-type H+-transporting ATPase subunit K
MEPELMTALGKLGAGAALALGATGSALGTGIAAQAAVGAWKKAFAQGKSAPFILVAFVGAPLSQTIYGMILMNNLIAAAKATPGNWPAMLGAGLLGGIAIGASAWLQGATGAAAADAQGETGKGFGNYLMALGIVETVALFVMVFIGATIAS